MARCDWTAAVVPGRISTQYCKVRYGPVKTGARWQDLPKGYPLYQTCHRRFQQWVEAGVFDQIIEALAQDFQQRGDIDLSECFIDGTFSLALGATCGKD